MAIERILFFDRLVNRYRIDARLVARTAFRIGRGRDDDPTQSDLPLLRGVDGRLLVPGSTWKGVLRCAAEQFLRTLAPDGEVPLWACDPFAEPCLTALDADERRELEGLSPERQVKWERKRIERLVCHACSLFGAPGLAAHLRASDTLLVDDARTCVRNGVGLDRDLGRAEDGLKYDFEVAEPGTPLDLVLLLENAVDWQVGLVLALVEDLDAGSIRVGGFGSRGLGWLDVDRVSVTRWDRSALTAAAAGEVLRDSEISKTRAAFAALGGVA